MLLTGNSSQIKQIQTFQLGPFNQSNESNHCLQFWYTSHGRGAGGLQIITYTKTGKQIKEISIFKEEDQSKFLWKSLFFLLEF